MISFAVHNFLVWCSPICLFVSLAWGNISNNILLWAMSEVLLPMFSSTFFIVSGVTFKSLIHFEFILVCDVKQCSSFIFQHIPVQFSHCHLLNKLSLAHCMCLLPLSNIDYKCVGLFLSSLFCSMDLCGFFFNFYVSTMLFWLLRPYSSILGAWFLLLCYSFSGSLYAGPFVVPCKFLKYLF